MTESEDAASANLSKQEIESREESTGPKFTNVGGGKRGGDSRGVH